MNESITPPANPVPPCAKWCDRHRTLNQLLISIGGPFIGGVPGMFMLWIVVGPVLHSHKFSPSAVLGLAFIASGILLMGVFLGAILACLTLISQRFLMTDTHSPVASGSPPTSASVKTNLLLILAIVAAIVFFIVGIGIGTAWVLHCVYDSKFVDSVVHYIGMNHGEISI